jgi:hypothetical protein
MVSSGSYIWRKYVYGRPVLQSAPPMLISRLKLAGFVAAATPVWIPEVRGPYRQRHNGLHEYRY